MSTAKNILGIIPGLQAVSLVAMNVPKKFSVKPSKKMGMKRQTKSIVKKGVGTMIGIGLITPTSAMINAID